MEHLQSIPAGKMRGRLGQRPSLVYPAIVKIHCSSSFHDFTAQSTVWDLEASVITWWHSSNKRSLIRVGLAHITGGVLKKRIDS